MIYDLDRNICAIKYNLLNLPDTIQFANGNLIVHQYDALGNKYSTTYYTRNSPIVVPVGNVVEQLGSAYNKQHYVYNDNVTYRQLTNSLWRIERIENAEGYIGYNIQRNSYLPYYYIKDYLGNVRETYMGSTNTSFMCVQEIQYYPSGLPWNDNYQPSQQPYKYGGKEFVEMHGLDEYDSQARWYYPALMRTTTQDPLAEKYYDISPYAWCANNPVNLVDPDGRVILIDDGTEKEKYDVNSQYTGKNEYIDLMYNALNEIYSIEMGKTVLDPLISSDDVYTILNKKSSKEETQSYTAKTKTMNITPKENTDDKLRYAINAIAHESFHAYQLYKGSSINTIHSEVEAYLYMDVILYRLKLGYPCSLQSDVNIEYNAILNILLYENVNFNLQNFNYLIENFKKDAKFKIYKNLIKSDTQTKYLLTPFFPLCHEKYIINN